MLAARTAAIGGESARLRDDHGGAMSLLQQALQRDAGVIRRFGFALPAHISGSGDASVARAVTLLARSPRFRDASWGFAVTVTKEVGGLKACLKAPDGATLTCTTAAPLEAKVKGQKPPVESPDDLAARLVETFHRDAFATRVGMSTQDLNSLDGSTTVATQAQREKMQGVLGDVAKDANDRQ